MSLSARIAIDPSRRLERLAMLLPVGGVVVAAAMLSRRWPQAIPLLLPLAAAGCAAIVVSVRRRRGAPITLTVSHHPEFDVRPDPVGNEGPWRLADSTVVWPGFWMLALRMADPSMPARVVRVPVLAGELAAADRRALSRFLIWSLHGGAGGDSRPRRP